ncbi:MAG TPA: uroporphyrinogen-III synthase [Elusimicrobiota bacterium]|nr:uroporphyrinogen-III synthase [Elusimicrobiota bacterium]
MARNSARGRTRPPLVLIARDPRRAREISRILKRARIRAAAVPVVRAAAPASWRGLDRALKSLADFDAAAFASANAVEAFFARARRLRLRKLKAPSRILAVGPATARSLARHGWRASLVAGNPGGANLARAAKNVRGLRVLAPRAAEGKNDLVRGLRAKGARVTAAEAYRTVPDSRQRAALRRLASNPELAAAVFFSGSAVHAFRAHIGTKAWNRLRRGLLFAALGPTAAQALRAAGARKIRQAPRADFKELARLLVRALSPS